MFELFWQETFGVVAICLLAGDVCAYEIRRQLGGFVVGEIYTCKRAVLGFLHQNLSTALQLRDSSHHKYHIYGGGALLYVQ